MSTLRREFLNSNGLAFLLAIVLIVTSFPAASAVTAGTDVPSPAPSVELADIASDNDSSPPPSDETIVLQPSEDDPFPSPPPIEPSAPATGDSLASVTPAPSSDQPIRPLRLLAPQVSTKVTSSNETRLESLDGKVEVVFPQGAVSEDVRVEYAELEPWPSSGMKMVKLFQLNGYAEARDDAKVSRFDKSLQITIKHDESDLRGIDVDSLHLYYLDEENGKWQPVTSQYDPETRTTTASVDHFTTFGEQAAPLISGPGKIMSFQNDLHSGAATGSYPIEIPPGAGGLTPKIELNYNSGSVDEMKNKRAVGSWVGIGWSLSLGKLSYDEDSGAYSLDLNGGSYRLASSDGVTYYTNPDQYLKIARDATNNKWDVWDREGTQYVFGGTADSKQYHDSTYYYRWDLSSMESTHDGGLHVIKIAYAQDVWNNTVRSAYAANVTYSTSGSDHVRIYFNTSFDYSGSDGNMRQDTPKGYVSNPAPKIVENKKLDSVEIKMYDGSTWETVRKYAFSYAYSYSYYSDDYGGIYYAGEYRLASITEKDKNDTALPATTFTYSAGVTRLLDARMAPAYSGNPGNPANFSRSRLASISNGYGATVTYTYTENPTGPVSNIWTRQVVTTKQVNPGIGPTMTYTYTYTGNPQYSVPGGNNWEAQYRGFAQVRETDSAGDYVIHYFNTVDPFDGDVDRLTGREIKTEWYASTGAMLRRVLNTWETSDTAEAYDFTRKWGVQLIGSDSQLNAPRGVATDSNGYVYVSDSENDRIQKFTSSGSFVVQWGVSGDGDGEFYSPGGIAVDSNRDVYVADSGNHRIQKFSNNGTFLTAWGGYGTGEGEFKFPQGVAVGGDGYVYVADTNNNRIQKFSSNGSFTTKWGDSQSLPSPRGVALGTNQGTTHVYVTDVYNVRKFTTSGTLVSTWSLESPDSMQPAGITVRSDGAQVYVTDLYEHRILVFHNSGSLVAQFGVQGSENGQYQSPYGIAASSDGYFYVADTNNFRIQKLDSNGVFVTKWGIYGNRYGLYVPYGVAASGDGYEYVVDYHRVHKFTASGEFVAEWGGQGTGDGQFFYPTAAAVDGSGSVYVADTGNNRVQKFDGDGTFVTKWADSGLFSGPGGIAVAGSGTIYVADTGNNRIRKFASGSWSTFASGLSSPRGVALDANGNVYVSDTGNHSIKKYNGSSGSLLGTWGSQGTGNGEFSGPTGMAVDEDGYVYVTDWGNNRVQKFSNNGDFVTKWGGPGLGDGKFSTPSGIAVGSDGDVYVADPSLYRVQKFTRVYSIRLAQVDVIEGSKTTRTTYSYDAYGNVVSEYREGDSSTSTDDSTVWRKFYPNTTDWIVSKPARERVYSGNQTTDPDDYTGNDLTAQTYYYYDSNNATTPPAKGDLTRVQRYLSSSNSTDAYYTYDSYGNRLTETDSANNTTTTTYDTVHHTYPVTKTYPAVSGNLTLTELVDYDYSSGQLKSHTDVNGQTTYYHYDSFWRLTKVVRPGDTETSPSTRYYYESWGAINQQHVKTMTKTVSGNWDPGYYPEKYLWQREFFDGLGRTVQKQAQSESTGDMIVASTITYDSRGNVDRQYVSQNATDSATYQTPQGSWKYSYSLYDGLARPTNVYRADSTWEINDYSNTWRTKIISQNDLARDFFYDAFGNLTKVQERKETYDYQLKWGSYGTGNSQFRYPLGIEVSPDDKIYVADWYNNKVKKFEPDGTFILSFGSAGTGDGQNGGPYDVAVDSSNNTYMVDYANSRVQKWSVSYNGTATFLGWFGKGTTTGWHDPGSGETGQAGSGNSEFINPYSVAVSSNGTIYVADAGNHRIQRFTSSGNVTFVSAWGTYGSSPGQFKSPSGVAVDPDGNVLVADWSNKRVQKFTESGAFVTQFGQGILGYVMDVATDSSGNAYVTEFYNNRVTKFTYNSATGEYEYAATWGTQGAGDGQLDHPWGVAVDASNKVYVANEYNNRIEKFQPSTQNPLYLTTTTYTYDISGNLRQVTDSANNTTTISYDWLGRKTSMTDPDMGTWSYGYDSNGNLTTQSDNKSQQITFSYDAMSRLTHKEYVDSPDGSQMTDIDYYYDSTTGGNKGKGRLTSMTDAAGTASYTYDTRGRLVSENRTIDSASYVTQYAYDPADRLATVTYPTTEVVTTTYDSRGMPYSLSSSANGTLVTSEIYNAMGQTTALNYANSTTVRFGYWGVGGSYDTSGGYYGKPWEIKTVKSGSPDLQDVQVWWDAMGNLTKRVDVIPNPDATENFSYDFLDRLTSVSGNYSWTWAYNEIGNITSNNGTSYTYGTKPHAVTQVGGTTYAYDSNGNMTTRGTQAIYWDWDNKPAAVADGLKALWKLDENTGSTANDSAGSNNGTIYGASWTTGHNGSALSFDGVNDYVDAGNSADLQPSSAITLEAWVYPKSTDPMQAIIKGDPRSNGYTLGMGYGQIEFGLALSTPLYAQRVDNLSANTWTHIALTWDDATDTVTIYKNGQPVYTATNKPGPLSSTSGNFLMGYASYYNPYKYWNGYIDDVRVYDRALSSDELAADYNGSYYGSTFVYDGNGNRVKKTETGQTTVYVGKYYETDVTSGNVTLNYYLGGRQVAFKKVDDLRWVSQDHLSGTSVTTDASGVSQGTINYYPFGATRSSTGALGTDKQFTGQRLDGTGLYYYGARYYDTGLGRFISPDAFVQVGGNAPEPVLSLAVSYVNLDTLKQLNELNRRGGGGESTQARDPQFLNRYAYGRNNPLAYKDDSGNFALFGAIVGAVVGFTAYTVTHRDNFSWNQALMWTGGGSLAGATLGTGVGLVAGSNLARTGIAAGSGMAAAGGQRSLESFRYAAQYGGIKTYGELTKLTGGTGLRVHHLIEERFIPALRGLDPRRIPSLVLTPEEHQVFTNAWRNLIGQSKDKNPLTTLNATLDDVWAAAQIIYRDYPELLDVVRQYLRK